MNKIAQDVRFRQALVTYAKEHGVTAAAMRYHTNRQYVYRWLRRYDGTSGSLMDKSRRPRYHPNQHTDAELKLVFDMWRVNKDCGLVVFWAKLQGRGYKRAISSLYRLLRRHSLRRAKPQNPKYVPKPYEQMKYPGERVQIDVKCVPASCLTGGIKGRKYYQYTAIDEYSRLRYLEIFEAQNQYCSAIFLTHAISCFGFRIECVQTDNGFEFTNRFNPRAAGQEHLFDKALAGLGIRHKLIRPYTPRHNGKVERSHRKDNEYFYGKYKFDSLEGLKKRLAVYNRKYNEFPMRPLGWKSPKETLRNFRRSHCCVTHV